MRHPIELDDENLLGGMEHHPFLILLADIFIDQHRFEEAQEILNSAAIIAESEADSLAAAQTQLYHGKLDLRRGDRVLWRRDRWRSSYVS